ncbi:hypothetical protein CI238_13205 [Colletotrichum incanum]|uniref:Uncharacterized protein n=1 Tax=Colletotrichum incanum TaxID=1573173 RepID=A0A161W9J0_COLIC|nr:hypothetical protein CI238_13205 [Colletotrichum incanum]
MKPYLNVAYAAALVSAGNPFLLGRDSYAGNQPGPACADSGDAQRQAPSLQSSALLISTQQPSTTAENATPSDTSLTSTPALGNAITTTLTLTLARPEPSSGDGERTAPQDRGPPVHVVECRRAIRTQPVGCRLYALLADVRGRGSFSRIDFSTLSRALPRTKAFRLIEPAASERLHEYRRYVEREFLTGFPVDVQNAPLSLISDLRPRDGTSFTNSYAKYEKVKVKSSLLMADEVLFLMWSCCNGE